jgi:hypothetical protein
MLAGDLIPTTDKLLVRVETAPWRCHVLHELFAKQLFTAAYEKFKEHKAL